MADFAIPPWIASINPTEPASRLLEGYRSGLAASEAQRRANEQSQAYALRAQEMAQLAAYRQQQQALQLEQLRIEQQKAEREATAAAAQLEGQRGIEADLAAGVAWPQALAKWSPKLFAGNPAGLARAMDAIKVPQAPIFRTSPEGYTYMQNPDTGATSLVPATLMREGFTPSLRTLGEGEDAVRVVETTPGGFHVLPQKPKRMSPEETKELQHLNTQEARFADRIKGMSLQEATESDPEAVREIRKIGLLRETILQGTWDPSQTYQFGEKDDKSKDEWLRLANAKIERIRRGIPPGAAQTRYINEVIAELRARGIELPQTQAPVAATPAAPTDFRALRGF